MGIDYLGVWREVSSRDNSSPPPAPQKSPKRWCPRPTSLWEPLGWEGKGQTLSSGTARSEAYLGQLSNLQVEADDKCIPANPKHQPGCILGKAEVGSGWGLGEWAWDMSMDTELMDWEDFCRGSYDNTLLREHWESVTNHFYTKPVFVTALQGRHCPRFRDN